MYKFFALAALFACATATPGYAGLAVAPAVGVVSPAYGSTAQSVSRSYDGGASVSQYSKAVDTAFSSVRKYDTRITNDARYLAAAPVATYAHAPVVAAAPVATYAHAPAVATYAHAPVLATRAYAPAVAAPVLARSAYAAPVAHAGLLGVAYSAAPAVSHISFDGFGAHYGW